MTAVRWIDKYLNLFQIYLTVHIRYQILGQLVTNFCTVSETLRISPNRTHIGPLRHLRHLTHLLDKRINTFVRHKNVHPETQSTHSVALSVEEKVAQLRKRVKFHQKDRSF